MRQKGCDGAALSARAPQQEISEDVLEAHADDIFLRRRTGSTPKAVMCKLMRD
ncbi:MAG: hypothetical protein ACLRSW_01350 [Christensenellaceae bacterium]